MHIYTPNLYTSKTICPIDRLANTYTYLYILESERERDRQTKQTDRQIDRQTYLYPFLRETFRQIDSRKKKKESIFPFVSPLVPPSFFLLFFFSKKNHL